MCWLPDRHPAWSLPWIVGLMFGVQGALFGTLTGGSANPARQLGPALFSGQVHLLAVYLIAPVIGGVSAAWTVRRAHARRADHRNRARSARTSRSAPPTRKSANSGTAHAYSSIWMISRTSRRGETGSTSPEST